MNNKEFVQNLSARLDSSNTEVQEWIQWLVKDMTACLQTDEGSIAIQGFGTIEVKKKNERISVNPGTQQRMLVPPKLTLSFRPSPKMKDMFNPDKK
jgi:DNA-binding protein HU-beta